MPRNRKPLEGSKSGKQRRPTWFSGFPHALPGAFCKKDPIAAELVAFEVETLSTWPAAWLALIEKAVDAIAELEGFTDEGHLSLCPEKATLPKERTHTWELSFRRLM